MISQSTCEQRIEGELKRELERISAILRKTEILENHEIYDDEELELLDQEELENEFEDDEIEELKELGDETIQSYQEGILAVDKHVVYFVQLSTGGPGDGFYLTVDDGEITRIEYEFLDWFDGARRVLHGKDFDLVSDIMQRVVYMEEA